MKKPMRYLNDESGHAYAYGGSSIVVIVLVGTTAALAEGDPGGAVGLLALLIMGVAGWVAAVRIRPRAQASRSGSTPTV